MLQKKFKLNQTCYICRSLEYDFIADSIGGRVSINESLSCVYDDIMN